MGEKTKHRLLLLLIAVTTIPFAFMVRQPTTWTLQADNIKTLSLYLSAILGYIGVSLLVWQLVLGTRSIAGLFFDDLASKIKLHKLLGKYGFGLVLLHPILITYSYGESLLYSILPDISNEFEKHVTFGRIAFVLLLIVWFTSAIIRSKLSYRPWKYIHYASYPIMFAAFLHVPEVGSSFGSDIVQIYWYSFVVVSVICVLLRMRHLFGYGKVRYEVASHKQIAPDIYLIRLLATEKNLQIRTGQYIYIQTSLLGEEHPFTVLDHDITNGEISVAYKHFGKFTDKLRQLKEGHGMLVDGPYGVFTKEFNESPDTPTVFIAGGIGVTPFVRHVIRASGTQHFMFYASQSSQMAVFRTILKTRLGKRYVDIFSAEKNETSGENVEYGLITPEVLSKYLRSPKNYRYYVCGPKIMMDLTKKSLHSLGVPKSQIYLEEFGF